MRSSEVLASVVAWDEAPWASLEGALIRQGPALVHSLRCSGELDVAWCRRVDGGLEVRRTATLSPRRVGRPCFGPVLAAAGGAFERWRLQVGDVVEIRGSLETENR
jgi:hypothetical protein